MLLAPKTLGLKLQRLCYFDTLKNTIGFTTVSVSSSEGTVTSLDLNKTRSDRLKLLPPSFVLVSKHMSDNGLGR